MPDEKIHIDQSAMLALVDKNNLRITDLDSQVSAKLIEKASLERQNTRILEQLTALQNTPESVEVVELEYRYIPIPSCTNRAYISTNVLRINRDMFAAMRTRSNCKVAVRVQQQGNPDRFATIHIDLKESKQKIARGIDDNGFNVVEYVERTYLERSEYQALQLKASAAWHDERLFVSGLRARLVVRD